jgi:DNA-binding transcriptional LysR family regulator
MQSLQRGRLMIGAIQGLSPFIDLPKLLGDFHREYPNVEIRLSFDETGALIDGVLDGRLDIAFTQFVEAPPAEVMATMLACDPLVLVCQAITHVLGNKTCSSPRSRGRTLSICRPGTERASWSIRALPPQDCPRRSAYEVDDLTMQLDMVAHGLGVALVPELVARSRMRKTSNTPLCLASLAEPEPCWELAVVFRKQLINNAPYSAAANACLALLPKLP